MNIFVTDYHPPTCALHHCRVHRVKMILEYAQLLSTYHHVKGSWVDGMYKPTHIHHPSAVWVRESEANYAWLFHVWKELLDLYELYSFKQHASVRLVPLLQPNVGYADAEHTYAMLAMPEEYKSRNITEAYQNYLNSKFSEWRSRAKPMPVEFDTVPKWYKAA